MISKTLLRSFFIGFLSWIAIIASASEAQNPLLPGVVAFTKAYNEWDGEGFAVAAGMFQKVSAQNPTLGRAFYWRGAAEFHRLLHLLGQSQTPAVKQAESQAMKRSIESLEQAVRLNENDAESHILLSTLYGMSIAESPVRAVWLGPSVMKHREKALKNDPHNPRAQYLTGMSYYYAPELLGGKAGGLAFLLKAERLFEAQAGKTHDPVDPLWGYGSCLTFIGKTSQALGRTQQAALYYRKALSVNPKDRLAQAGIESLKSQTPGTGDIK